MNQPPRWYRPVTIIALLWNLMGCAAYLSDVMLTPEDVAKMSAGMQQLYASRSRWAVSATALAVWGGAIGSLALLLRRQWALPALGISLAGVVAQDVGLFLLTDTVKLAGPAVVVAQGLVLVVAIGLVFLARRASASGWNR
ncbi:MAG: hypothetical protein K1Y01_14660 [Vicinamibacteria bacterium]|nr:hypothetical protein [Vicinamibacteria bacterium]